MVKTLYISLDLWASGSYVVFYTHWMGLIPRQQCRKAPASVAEKGHILDLLIKLRRLPCFKSKALFRLQEGVLHRLWGFFSALKREAKMTNMSVIYSVGMVGETGEMILLSAVTVQCSSRSFAKGILAVQDNSFRVSVSFVNLFFTSCLLCDSCARRPHAWGEE